MPAHDTRNVHLVIQGKGGGGKSTTATILAQWLIGDDPQRATCIDTDPINASFAAYRTLGVQRVEIMQDRNINPRRFDEMIELITANSRDAVIDNGASSFVALADYLLTNQIAALLENLGRSLVLHVPIVGGPAFLDTLQGFDALLNHFHDSCRFVVWLNPYFGPVQHEGKSFEELRIYTENKERIAALITLPTLQPDTFGADLRSILMERRTFNEAIRDVSTGVVTRQRLKLIRQQIFSQLDAAAEAGVL